MLRQIRHWIRWRGALVTFVLLYLTQSFGDYSISGQNLQRSTTITAEQLNSLVREELGSKIKAAIGVLSEPTYLLGDFNGDGYADIAIVVLVEEGRDELQQHGLRYIDVDPYSRTNGQQLDPTASETMWHNCLGVTFLHGSSKDWNPRTISNKFLIYNCFSSFRRVPKSQRIRRGTGSIGPTPRPKGDSILLDLETGGTALVYWNGKTYRGFGIRRGD